MSLSDRQRGQEPIYIRKAPERAGFSSGAERRLGTRGQEPQLKPPPVHCTQALAGLQSQD